HRATTVSGALSSGEAGPIYPPTGHRRLLRRPTSGHAAAAPPSAASNFHRPMVTVIRPSRARCVKETIPRHARAVPNSAAPGAAGAPTPVTGCNGAPPDPTQLPAKSAFL